eukprot:CAMPEP_0201513194 /NCGR_PEP_ID=MMETSP0161_2-20130828/5300_1 /ASSEMBLY_ACC=CAM_ASM_000251 /TAXON_ID=180227 /ORGANISM="Neoparamoeba aestuarina, Strain SoJaBio B1-5/56/2" /LENGTH=330 /DNA_ID=CAMNT_0047909319 /DNA_START=90 /DNA_END=1082 /DNA_ORIENTATION=+
MALDIEYADSTHTGSRYGTLNQDASLCFKISSSPHSFLFAVCDGHGELGELTSQIALETFKNYFGESEEQRTETIKKLQEEPTKTMEEMFLLAHEKILEMQKNPPETYTLPVSPPVHFALQKIEGVDVYVNKKNNRDVRILSCGTTAIVTIVVEQKLYVAGVGDSSAFLVRDKKKKDFLYVVDLIPPHNMDNYLEKERIESEGTMKVTKDNYIYPTQAEHVRVCTLLSTQPPPLKLSDVPAPQLAITRSLGHPYPSVSPKPDVKVLDITRQDKFLFLVSDGVTDVLTCRDAMNIIADAGEVKEGAKQVVARAIQDSLGSQDNTTCLVVFF